MDRFMMWSIVASVCIVLLAFGSVGTLVWMMERTLCSEWDIGSVLSPDGSLEAVTHETDCGAATTQLNTQVSTVRRIFGIETSREPLFVVHGE